MLPETDVQKIARLEQENGVLRATIEELTAEVQRLKQLLKEAVRAGKRQAAPFSRQKPKANPQSPVVSQEKPLARATTAWLAVSRVGRLNDGPLRGLANSSLKPQWNEGKKP